MNRREALKVVGGAIALTLNSHARAEPTPTTKSSGSFVGSTPEGTEGFVLPPLPYAYDALESVVDEETMRLHHDKHHPSYVTGLNAALKGQQLPKLAASTENAVDVLLRHIKELPAELHTPVRNFGGGHANHSLFWNSMTPNSSGDPKGAFRTVLEGSFQSLQQMKHTFEEAGKKQFGSGWVWLSMRRDNTLVIHTTANQDSPLLEDMTPLLGNDLWEHAYYLRYKNLRGDYLSAWWKVVNWEIVEQRYEAARKPV